MDLSSYIPYLTVNGASKHTIPDGKVNPYNESNDGFGIKLKNTTEEGLLRSLFAGQYDNSLGRNSIYAGAEFGTRLFGDTDTNLSAALRTGLISGYNDSVVPMLSPVLTFGLGDVDINLGYIPAITGLTPEVFTLNADYKLPKNLFR